LISLALGTVIGQSYDNTVLPLVAGFAVLSGLSMAVIRFAEAGNPVAGVEASAPQAAPYPPKS
jgi:hypothetical protein